MILSNRVALGGQHLDAVDSAVVIRSVDPGTPKETVNTVNRMGGSGSRVTGTHPDYLEIKVTYAIDLPKTQMAARRAVFDAVNAWAEGGGWLTVNWMEGKRAYADYVILPSSGSMFEWTNEYTIVFRAYGVPFWQDSAATSSTGASITVPGVKETVCDAELVNGSGATINTLTITVGSSYMTFTDLGLADGDRLVIGHTNDGTLYIRKYTGTSYYVRVMEKRTAGSDELYVKPGARSIAVSASDVTWTVSCYGRYA